MLVLMADIPATGIISVHQKSGKDWKWEKIGT